MLCRNAPFKPAVAQDNDTGVVDASDDAPAICRDDYLVQLCLAYNASLPVCIHLRQAGD